MYVLSFMVKEFIVFDSHAFAFFPSSKNMFSKEDLLLPLLLYDYLHQCLGHEELPRMDALVTV